jgi:hypothetical protein
MHQDLAESICDSAKELDPSDFEDRFSESCKFQSSLADLCPFIYESEGTDCYAVALSPEQVLMVVVSSATNFVDGSHGQWSMFEVPYRFKSDIVHGETITY